MSHSPAQSTDSASDPEQPDEHTSRKLEFSGRGRVVSSILWLTFDRALRMGIGVVVGSWVARYLGPGDFGIMNFAIAFVGLFMVFASLGLDRIVIMRMVRDPGADGEILASALVARLCGFVATVIMSLVGIRLTQPGDSVSFAAVTVVCIANFFTILDVFDWHFQATVCSKYSVWARNSAFVLSSGVKLALIWMGAPLLAFLWVLVFETALGTVLLLVFYVRARGGFKGWRWRARRIRHLLAESWPQMVASLAIFIYMKIDQVMLNQLSGSREVGLYSAAVRLSEIWYFIPLAVTSATFPSIVRARETNRPLYQERIQRLFSLMFVLATLIALPVALLAGPAVALLYGSDFTAAAPILSIHIWASLFVFWGTAQEPWNLAEGLMRLSLVRTIAGAVLNIGLNFLVIPKYGGLGAAWATVVSYAVSAVFANLLAQRTRGIFIMQMKSILFPRYLLGRT